MNPLTFLKLSLVSIIAGVNVNAAASEIKFLNNPSRVEINGGTSQEISAGETLNITYDESRLNTCNSSNRLYQSFLILSYHFDDQQVHRIPLDENSLQVTASIQIPAGTHQLTVWFHNYSIQTPGAAPVCDAFDSNFGENFNFKIQDRTQ